MGERQGATRAGRGETKTCSAAFTFESIGSETMPAGNLLYWALVALVIAIIAAVLGFGGIAGTAAGIAKLLFYVFIVIFLVVLVMNFIGRSRTP